MFKSLVIISLAASVAVAQTSSAIPAGISEGCAKFLTSLNTDSSLKTCLTSLTTATADYQPGSSKPSSDALINSTLGNLCSSSVNTNCPEALIRGKIAEFYPACSAELTSKLNPEVVGNYDSLYVLYSFRTAICSKDDSGNFCVLGTKLPASQTAAQMQKVLATSNLTPNATTYRTSNLPFLFLQSNLPSADLCNVCTRNIMTAYMNFEAKVPYAPGLGNSMLLTNQPELYQGIQNTCGSNFLSGAGVQAAGGLSGGTLSGGAVQIVTGASQVFLIAGMGVMSLLALSAF